MKKRILSGIVMVLIAIPVLMLGGIIFDIACSLIAIGAFCELINANKKKYIPNIMRFIGIVCMILLMFINVDGHSFVFGLSFETLSLVFLLILLPTIFLRNQDYKTENGFYLAAVTIFLGTVFNLFITLYNESIESFIYVILIACMTDIFALFGGKLIGRHKLTTVSPNKTIEGSIVGTIVATIIATTYYAVFIVNNLSTMGIVIIVLITIFLSIMGQLGDLFFSLIKRENNIKDYSNLIPGHGGILDRIDSIIFILIAFIFIIQFI